MKILIFAGTKNGRELVSTLASKGHDVIVSSMSAYGAGLIENRNRVQSIFGKKSIEEICQIVVEESVDILIDSTHPYAVEISKNLLVVQRIIGVKLVRYERETVIPKDVGRRFSSMEAVLRFLEEREGNILFTTGVNDIAMISKRLEHNRIYARVLPVASSKKVIEESRLPLEQVVMENPPFSVAANLKHIDAYAITYLVTKDSGKEGNIQEKLEAALRRNVDLLVIDRPQLSYEHISYTEQEVIDSIG